MTILSLTLKLPLPLPIICRRFTIFEPFLFRILAVQGCDSIFDFNFRDDFLHQVEFDYFARPAVGQITVRWCEGCWPAEHHLDAVWLGSAEIAEGQCK